MMTKQIDLNRYAEFVEGVTSQMSNDLTTFIDRLDRVDDGYEKDGDEYITFPDVNVPLLITAAMGMGGEAGEFSEIVKKVMFHGKDLNAEVHAHLAKELGDVIWYWTNACRALKLDPNKVISDNVAKLEARYPGGKFDVFSSENRKEGDI
jgi:NTP pyrophosphatase (non-canonical NTP hydrolase)